jgi:hypothetical protein
MKLPNRAFCALSSGWGQIGALTRAVERLGADISARVGAVLRDDQAALDKKFRLAVESFA